MLAIDDDPREVGRCGGGDTGVESAGKCEPRTEGGLGGEKGAEERVGVGQSWGRH